MLQNRNKKDNEQTYKKRNNYNAEVVKVLSEEFEVTKQFVRQSIRQDRTSLIAETIRKKYFQMTNATKRAIERFKNNPINQ